MRKIQPPANCNSFLLRSIQQYEEMMSDISMHKGKGLERIPEIESCFQIASHYRNILLNELICYNFENQKEEIFFFKKIKPLFNAEMEFYGLCNYAEIFKRTVSDKEPPAIEPFYRKETGRLEKFGKEYTLFYNYVKEGETNKDAEWFTRLEEQAANSLYDGLMGTYLAIEKYVELMQHEIKQLQKESNE